MQARNQCAREIFSSRGGLDAVASVLEWGSLADGGGRRRTPGTPGRLSLAPLRVSAQRWCCAMPRNPAGRRDAAEAAREERDRALPDAAAAAHKHRR